MPYPADDAEITLDTPLAANPDRFVVDISNPGNPTHPPNHFIHPPKETPITHTSPTHPPTSSTHSFLKSTHPPTHLLQRTHRGRAGGNQPGQNREAAVQGRGSQPTRLEMPR